MIFYLLSPIVCLSLSLSLSLSVCDTYRKVCKDCLCPREDHDIREDAGGLPGRVSVGKILFSPDVETTTRRSGDAPGSPKYGELNVDKAHFD